MTFSRAIRAAPSRQRHRRDHGQELGRQPDRKGHREEQRLERGPVHRDARRENHEDEDEHRARDEQPEVAQAALELRLGSARLEPRDDVAELREVPVAMTRAVAVPLTIDVPSQTSPAGSPLGQPVRFSAGNDSPVIAASCT